MSRLSTRCGSICTPSRRACFVSSHGCRPTSRVDCPDVSGATELIEHARHSVQLLRTQASTFSRAVSCTTEYLAPDHMIRASSSSAVPPSVHTFPSANVHTPSRCAVPRWSSNGVMDGWCMHAPGRVDFDSAVCAVSIPTRRHPCSSRV